MYIFLQLHSVLACLGFDCRFVHVELNVMGKGRNWGLEDQGRLQKSPIGPSWMIQDKNPQTKKSTKCSVREASEPQWPGPPRAARGINHGQWWGWHSRASLSCFGFVVFFRGLSFSYVFFRFFPFKRWCTWSRKGPNSTPFHTPFSISLVLDYIREKERQAKIARIPCRVCDQKIEARFWLSFLFLLFSFLNLVLCFVIFNLNIVVWSWIHANSSLTTRSCVSFDAFEFIEWFYRFLDANCLARILIKFLHLLGFGWWTKRWNLKSES